MSAITRIKGFADLLPPDSAAMRRMEQVALEVFSRYGFQELRIPLLEKTELFARSIGEDTDVVMKEMYTFKDRKDRSLTLRPEATAGVLRAFIENSVHAREPVSRFFTLGPMFRYERPQKGRMRQFHQINAECLGAPEPQADAELLLMLHDFLSALKLPGLSVELNSLGCKVCRPTFHEALESYFASLPQESFCDDCRRRMRTNPLRVLDCKVPQCRKMLIDSPVIADFLCVSCAEHFHAVIKIIDRAGLAYTLNPRLVRGLDYYVRTTFEVTSGDIGAQSSVAGGGRYDGLIKQLGGPDISGIGFACGMERLALLLPRDEGLRPDFFLATLDSPGLEIAPALATELRSCNLSGTMSFAATSLKSQMRQANRSAARFCVLLGGEELARGALLLKNMGTGEQQELSAQDFTPLVNAISNGK